MKLKLAFFGVLTEVTGESEMDLYTDDLQSVELLDEYLNSNYPLMGKHKYKVAVNQDIVSSDTVLHDGDEIAFLPPFAGG